VCEEEVITEESILLQIKVDSSSTPLEQPAAVAEPASPFQTRLVHSMLEDMSLRAMEAEHILKVLELMGGNKRQSAKALGVSRSTLDRKLAEIQDSDA